MLVWRRSLSIPNSLEVFRMKIQRTLLASAVLSAISTLAYAADPADADIQKVVVTANPFRSGEGDQILAPAKILTGDELRDKVGNSLGETLSQELGVSSSAFGAGASRPIIRGMEGSRVKMMENGMAVSDVSGLSNDHAVSAEGAIAQQIEILRGPAALLYGSGAIGGLVNVVNERIPTALEPKLTGQAETRYSTVDDGRSASGTLDGKVGKFALHADGSIRYTSDYKIPGARNVDDPDSASGRLPHSATREKTAGVGSSYVDDWGYAGFSVSTLKNLYGIPSEEGSKIDQKQTRFDFDSLIKQPFGGLESLRLKAGYTDYKHAELGDDNAPVVKFTNRALETRVEATHKPLFGWHGTFGIQTENTHFSALSADNGPDTVPVTHSTSHAGFLVEEKDFGPVRVNAGVRYEKVKREPVTGLDRSFDLKSGSVGAMWGFAPGYGVGATFSRAERAPATEELYSSGPHDATITFDMGDPNLRKETSNNIELTLQKNTGLIQWKANVFRNSVKDFIYGHITDRLLDDAGEPGGAFRERLFQQADATVRGAEAEVEYNPHNNGWNGRIFADTSRGKFDDSGSLPLQPATRFGASVGYKTAAWRAGLSLIHAQAQDRLASWETTDTASYNQLSANFSYRQKLADYDLTWFLIGKNLLNEDIRVSTSLLKDISPLAGRSLVFGVRAKF
jgi:iron complex outermembrane receptor protein